MGSVDVVDRGSSEIVVFCSGAVDGGLGHQLDRAVGEVRTLANLHLGARVLVNLGDATSCDETLAAFVARLREAVAESGSTVDLTNVPDTCKEVVDRLT